MKKLKNYIKKKILKKIKTINEKRNFMVNCKKMNIPFNVELAYKDEKELEYLRQIETELEAWEVVKPGISIEHLEDCQIRIMYGENPFMNVLEEKATKVKKAMEVSNER